MKNPVKKSDFILTPYMKSNDWRASYQILNTVIPYVGLWFLTAYAAKISYWFLPPIIILMTLFSARCFSLMHDCGHYSLFNSKKLNRCVGFLLGVINGIPQYPWSRGHAYHHKTNGDWERYRGIATFISTDEFAKLSPSEQKSYELLRHPLMALPGGFFYLAIKPRIALILGIYGFIVHAFNCFRKSPHLNLMQIIYSYKSKNWYTAGEFWDLLLNNICVITSWILMSHALGVGLFCGVYGIVLTLAAAIFICVFFVQHNFEGSYAHTTEGWDYMDGAIAGSSYLELPTILKWFSADIGYHHIHHLSERIPNYNLEACYHQNSHLLQTSKKLTLADMPKCAKFILWHPKSSKLMSIAEFHAMNQINTTPEKVLCD